VFDIFACVFIAAGLAVPRFCGCRFLRCLLQRYSEMPSWTWGLTDKPLGSIRPLPSTSSVADITRIVLCSVYRRVASEQESEWASPEASADSSEDDRDRTLIAHWRQHPLKDAWKESACTLIYALSGVEFACISNKKLKELGTTLQLHLYVRKLMKLEEHISLALHYVDCRSFDGLNKPSHVVSWEDSERLNRYLRGAILAVVVHQ